MPARASSIIMRLGLAGLAALLAWHTYGFIQSAVRAIAYRFELDYGEGIVWFQMKQLFSGEAFGDIDRFGGIVFHYTPFYHFVTGLIAATGIDGLAAGRIVAVLSTLAMVVLIGAIVRLVLVQSGGSRRAAALSGAIAGLTLLMVFPIKIWGPLMRVDMLAFALTLGGVLSGIKAIERPKLIYLSAMLFVLAVYTKQTMIAAPAALFLVLLVYRPRTAVAGILTCLIAGGAALAALAVATGGGFLRHVFLYNVNRLDPERADWIAIILTGHFLLVAAALAGLARMLPAIRRFVADRREAEPKDAVAAFLGLYFLLTTISLALILKSGSGVNYFIEWMAVLAILAGLAIAPAVERALSARAVIAPLAGLAGRLSLVALIAQALLLEPSRYAQAVFTNRVPGLTILADRIAQADKPVISDDMVVLMRAGKPVLWEPAIFAELGSNGVWDERPFVHMIEQRRFAFFVTNQDRGGHLFRQRYNPAVIAAMDRAYPRRERIAGLTLYLPE